MSKQKPFIVPQPEKYSFDGKWNKCTGISNFPQFIRKEFNVNKGNFKIQKINAPGNGLEITGNIIKVWGDQYIYLSTLCQLLIQGKGFLPEVTIMENMAFSFRAYHLDIARGGVPTLNYFKKIIRLLFLFKYNYFAIYFEDLFPWQKYPQIGKERGRLTLDELREIIRYGKQLGIEVFPSLELSGHMEQMLQLPEFRKYSEWNASEGCLNPADKEARKFTHQLLEEAISYFPEARYIHIGGDETWVLGRGKSLDVTAEFRGPELYEIQHREFINIVRRAGKEPMLWGDMLSGMYLEEKRRKRWFRIMKSPIWNNVTIANWNYSASKEDYFVNKIKTFKERRQIVAPGLSNWGRFYPDFDNALLNLERFLKTAREHKVPGFLITSWGDNGAECMYKSVEPLLLAAAEAAHGNLNWEEKWVALSGENEKIITLRRMFGHNCVGAAIKHLIFSDIVPDARTVRYWKGLVKQAKENKLPEDLKFICDFLEAGLKKLDGKLKLADIVKLAGSYKKLWISERKPANLNKVISKFNMLHFV
ncbi:MAG: beta-N-acetylhexosaminidase [Planctomycetota bacterium]